MTYEKEIDLEVAGWTFKRIGKNIWKIYPTASPHSITMTGSDVTTPLTIPFPHRLVRLTFFHTDSSYAAVTDELDITLKRTQAQGYPQKFEEIVYYDASLQDSYPTARGGETYEYEGSVYQLILKCGTSGHLVFPVLYIQMLEGGLSR